MEASAPSAVTLGLPRPNPFNPFAHIPVRFSHAGSVELAIHDARGRRVASRDRLGGGLLAYAAVPLRGPQDESSPGVVVVLVPKGVAELRCTPVFM